MDIRILFKSSSFFIYFDDIEKKFAQLCFTEYSAKYESTINAERIPSILFAHILIP